MNTLQVRELKTDWEGFAIGRVERAARSRTMILKGIDGARRIACTCNPVLNITTKRIK